MAEHVLHALELLLFGIFVHATVRVIGSMVPQIRSFPLKQRIWIVCLLLASLMLLAAIHLVTK